MTIPIKICGITRREDAQLAIDLGAWAIGFIFYPQSPRYIAPQKAGKIIASLKEAWQKKTIEATEKNFPVKTVGVFVNTPSEQIRSIARESGISTVQLAGDESPADVAALSDLEVIKTIRLYSPTDLSGISSYTPHVAFLLFDAPSGSFYGGTGKVADWTLIAQVPRQVSLILAGGLSIRNVANAVATVKPNVLDLSSGVEQAPGIKDHQKLRDLFRCLEAIHD